MSDLEQLVAADKSIDGRVEWKSEPLHFTARPPLLIDGVGVRGLFLRIKIPKRIDGFGFLLQTELGAEPRKCIQLERVEWKVPHTNINSGPPTLRLLAIPSTHHHSFALNYVRSEDRMRTKNLPLAVPVDPVPETISEYLAKAEKLLRIKGLKDLRVPAHQGTLF